MTEPNRIAHQNVAAGAIADDPLLQFLPQAPAAGAPEMAAPAGQAGRRSWSGQPRADQQPGTGTPAHVESNRRRHGDLEIESLASIAARLLRRLSDVLSQPRPHTRPARDSGTIVDLRRREAQRAVPGAWRSSQFPSTRAAALAGTIGRAVRPARGRVWLLTFIFGVAVGALSMWWLSAKPTSSASRTDEPTTIAVATPSTTLRAGATAGPAAVPAETPTGSQSTDGLASSVLAARVLAAAALTPPPVAVPARLEVPPPVTPARVASNRTSPRGAAVAARAAGFRGSIAVQSKPEGATVFVNGRSVGSTPVVLRDVPVGSRALRIEAPGYLRWSAAIRVAANEQTRVTAWLEPAP